MIGKFLESLGTRLAERWAAVTAPALLFWALAALTYANAHGGSSAWHDARDWFAQQDGAVQVVVIGGALAGVMLSATLVQWMTVPAIRALEGYWPFLAPLQRVINTRRRRRIENDEKRWQQLMSDVHDGNPSPEARRELMNVEARLSRVPPDPRERMPTRLGDVLRAGETWPRAKYGLDAAVCLPRIWLLLPETTRSELGMARARLDAAVAVWSWALLSLALTIWAWWAAPIAIVVLIGVYGSWILRAAQAYGALLEATFDVHRALLYEAVPWPRPASPGEERASGEALSVYLYRGTVLQPVDR